MTFRSTPPIIGSILLILLFSSYLPAQRTTAEVAAEETSDSPEPGVSKYTFSGLQKSSPVPSACLIETDVFGRNLSRNDQSIDTSTCYTNDEVEICFQVIGFGNGGNCQWLQGIVPDFGDCFDAGSFSPSGEPVMVTTPLQPMLTSGEWRWHPAGEITYKPEDGPLAPGEPVGAGWFFTSFDVGPDNCNTHPSCSFGDGDQCDGAPGVIWEVCFQLASGCPEPGREDCEISFKTYSDGEIGGFPEEGCQLDEETLIAFRTECCEPPEILSPEYAEVCSGEQLILPLSSNMDPMTTFEWTVSDNPYGATSGSGPVITDYLYNYDPFPVTVTYFVTGTCDLGCLSDIHTIELTIYPAPDSFIFGESEICEGDCFEFTLQLDGPPGLYDINWSDGSQGTNFTDCPAPGTYFYSVQITNQYGCFDYQTIQATVVPSPNVVILSSGGTACTNPTLTAVPATPEVGYQYLWNTGATTQSIEYQTGGNYEVTVTEASLGCIGYASIEVTAPTAPELPVISGPDQSCNDAVVCFTNDTPGGAWSAPVDENGCWDISGLAPGTYSVAYNYTDEDGCPFVTTHDFTVNSTPRIGITFSAAEACIGEVLEFEAEFYPADAQLSWSVGGATVVSGGINEAMIGLSWPDGGSRTVGVSATVGNCMGFAETEVMVLPHYATPSSTCSATPSSVTFSWEAGPAGTVYVIRGATQSENSYTVSDLAPEEVVDLEVEVDAPGFCGKSTFALSCSSAPCPEVSLSMQEDLAFCVGDGAQVQSLLVEAQGDDGAGTGLWAGPGIVDGEAGTFDPGLLGTVPGVRVIHYTYTNGNCVYRYSTNITLSPAPEADAGEDVALSYDESTLQLSGSGTEGASAVWSGPGLVYGVRTFSPSVNRVGTYILTSTDPITGCSAQDSVTVGFDYGPTLGRIASSNDVFTCNRAQITLRNTEILRPNWTVHWSGPGVTPANAGLPELNVEAPGWYYLRVHNPDNSTYSAVDSVYLDRTTEAPEIELTRNGRIDCALQEVHFQNTGFQENVVYRWTGPDGQEELSPVYTARTPGTHRLLATDTLTGCTNTRELIVEDLRSTPAVALPAGASLDCDGGVELSAIITDPAPLTLSWTGPNGDFTAASTLRVSAPGTYRLTAVNPANSCSVSLEIPVSGPELTLVQPVVNTQNESCYLAADGWAEVMPVSGGTPPYLYALDDGDFSSEDSFPALPPGNYVVKVQDAEGCLQDRPFTISPALPLEFDLGTNKRVRLGKMVEISPALADYPMDRIEWVSELEMNCLSDNCAAVEVMPLAPGWVQARLRTPAGCEVTDSLYIDTYSENLLYLPSAFSPNGDGTNDVFFPQGNPELATVKALRVFDRWGNLVFGSETVGLNDETAGWDGRRAGKALSPAVYVYQVAVAYLTGEEETIIGEVVLLR